MIDNINWYPGHMKKTRELIRENLKAVDAVIEIVDSAIRHVDRKNMSHFMDVLLAKRYDDDDYIVLREKDFLN